MNKTYTSSKMLTDAGAISGVSLRVEGKPNNFSMRRNGGADEEANRNEFFVALGFNSHSVARGEQVHGDVIRLVEKPGTFPGTDALVTRRTGILLAVSIADCTPILIFDKRSRTVAAVHSGWRGTVKQICAKTVDFLLKELYCQGEDIYAFIGPSAGACCYEVGEEVVREFSPDVYTESGSPGKYKLDLKTSIFKQLQSSGVPPGNIEVSGACTICDRNYHSYRREGVSSGRMLAAIGLK